MSGLVSSGGTGLTIGKQSGLTVAVTSPVLSALQTAHSQIQAAGDTRSSRMQALAGANAALSLKQAGDAISGGQGMVKGPDGQPVDGNAADRAGGIGISISLGSSKSQSTQSSSSDSARGSSVIAAGDIHIRASGAGTQGEGRSDITLQGSEVKAGGSTRLSAENDVRLLAAANTAQEQSASNSSSGSIGVGVQLGAGGAQMGVTASASKATGQGAGNSVTYTNTRVSGNTVNIDSGGDTTLKGAVVQGEQVTANVGGKLTIESQQDSSQYRDKNQQIGGSLTIGPAPGGSINAGQSKINSSYQSVNEQTAIRAGDAGFEVNVGGNTTLAGGQITSTQAAIDNAKNSFQTGGTLTTTDLSNTASFEASSVSVGLGAGTPKPGASGSAGLSGVGIGSDKGSASSTTTAAISGIAGNSAARTGDTETGIKPIFNKEQVQKEVNAQVAITQEAGKLMPKFIAEQLDKKKDELKTQATQAASDGDTDKAQALTAEAQKYAEGGIYRIAAHTALGALAGGSGGALGAAASSAAAPTLNDIQSQLQAGLQSAGMGADEAKLIASLAGGATAAGIGAAASGGSTAGAATAFNADMNNRQLHPTEIKWIKDNAKRYAQQQGISEAEAEKKLAEQAFRQVQFGVEGATDVSAQAFLKEAGNQLLPGDANVPGQNVGYMFYATPAQKANPGMYAQAVVNDPQALAFYAKQGLVQPSTANLLLAAQNDKAIRDVLGKGTLGAAALAVGVTLPPALSWCLSNPVGCNSALITGGEIAAGDALGPMGLAIGSVAAAKAGLKGMKSAEEANAVMRAAGSDPAWAPGTAVINAELKPGTKVQMVVTEEQYLEFMKPLSPGQTAKLPLGNWATFDDVASQVQARQSLAIKPDYKPDVKYVFEYEVVKPLNADIGFVGEQTNNAGGLLRGGGTQMQFDWSKVSNRSDYLKPVGQPKMLPDLLK